MADSITSVLHEHRRFDPPEDLARHAHCPNMANYEALHRKSLADPAGFWGPIADNLHWIKKYKTVLDWQPPDAKWFLGGLINVAENCLDAQVAQGRGDTTAILWESEPVDEHGQPREVRRISFAQLTQQTAQFAGVLRKLGVRKGDRVTIYLPMVPELAIAMLACARIGAAHSVIFGGFSAQAIADRMADAQSTVIITADGAHRRGAIVPLKDNVDQAAAKYPNLRTAIVLQRTGHGVSMTPGRDLWWHELLADPDLTPAPPEPMDSEDLLFLLYTSGSTGKPKGIFHTTAGYLVQAAATARYTFDLRPADVYWCTADCGWITGHTYVVYGILACGVTTLMYEGAPNFPDWDRFWAIIARHKVTKFYTAPTAIRAFMRQGPAYPAKHDLSSLKILGTVGEPINPEAWMWYREHIGRNNCPIVDTWWQTETGGHMITPLPGATPTKPGSATRPFFGIDAAVVDRSGKDLPPNEGGFLVIRKPWPGMLRGIWNDRERFIRQYFSEIPGVYFAGDAARRDEDGYFWIQGRVDDVIKVSGHRLGTAEVESALVSHPKVAECAVVPVPDEITGEAIVAFVTLIAGEHGSDQLKAEIERHVETEVGKIARPRQIRFAEGLPKTRSGKIMRRLLKEMATSGEVRGDVTTLEDFNVLAKLKPDTAPDA